MKQSIATLIILSGVLLLVNLSQADNSQLHAFYDGYLTEKIANCERIASIRNSQNSRMTELVKMRGSQAEFYSRNKAKLIKIMVARDIGKEPHKIDHFLITQFKNGQYTLSKY